MKSGASFDDHYCTVHTTALPPGVSASVSDTNSISHSTELFLVSAVSVVQNCVRRFLSELTGSGTGTSPGRHERMRRWQKPGARFRQHAAVVPLATKKERLPLPTTIFPPHNCHVPPGAAAEATATTKAATSRRAMAGE